MERGQHHRHLLGARGDRLAQELAHERAQLVVEPPLALLNGGLLDAELEAEDDEDITVDYYGTQLVMSDIEDAEVHCVASDAAAFRCFDTIEEADAVHVPAADSLTAETKHQAASAFCRFFEHSNEGGSSIRWDLGINISRLPDWGWNDRISSLECTAAKARVYEDTWYSGDTRDFNSTFYVGNLWNDQISSLKVLSP